MSSGIYRVIKQHGIVYMGRLQVNYHWMHSFFLFGQEVEGMRRIKLFHVLLFISRKIVTSCASMTCKIWCVRGYEAVI